MEYAYLSKTTGENFSLIGALEGTFSRGGALFSHEYSGLYINLLWKMFLNFKFQKNTPINLN